MENSKKCECNCEKRYLKYLIVFLVIHTILDNWSSIKQGVVDGLMDEKKIEQQHNQELVF